jgi:hypothetical protein
MLKPLMPSTFNISQGPSLGNKTREAPKGPYLLEDLAPPRLQFMLKPLMLTTFR